MKNIQHLRLSNGDEIITDVLEQNENSILVSEPYTIEEIRADGQATIILSKYMLSPDSENELRLKPHHIVTQSSVHKEIERYYHNSVIYNKDIELSKIQEIKRVNEAMEKITKGESDLIIRKQVPADRVIILTSNSIH